MAQSLHVGQFMVCYNFSDKYDGRCSELMSALGQINMSNIRRKTQILLALAALLLLATAVGCKGFFVNSPNAITISPNPAALSFNQPQQLTATASFDSGPNQDVSSTATWSTGNVCVVSVTNSGIATAVGTGPATTITAIFNGASGTVTATGPSGLTISPCGTFNKGGTQTFTASSNGGSNTAALTWTSSDTSKLNFTSPSSGVATFGPNTGSVTISVSDGGANSGQLAVTVQ